MSDFEQALHKLVQQELECITDHADHDELEQYIKDNAGDLQTLLASLNHYFKLKAKEVQHGQGTAA